MLKDNTLMNPFERLQLVILSYNRLDCLPRLFEELLVPAARQGVQVTFIDNASDSDLRKFLTGFSDTPNIEICFNSENYGVAKGRNGGFRRSQREFVVNLDDDSLMSLDSLERVPAIFDELTDAGILAFHIIHGISGDSQNHHGKNRILVGNFHGAGHAIRRDVFYKVGYLDERCFFGAEELEFTMRTLLTGMTTIYTPDVVVRHFSYQREGNILIKRRIYWARNYAMVLFRYLSFGTALLFSLRLLTLYVFNGFKSLKFRAFVLPFAMIFGAFEGLKIRTPLGAEWVKFYTSPGTRPELGNVSITSKIIHRLNINSNQRN